MNYNRKFGVLVGVLIMLSVFAACQASPTATPEPTTPPTETPVPPTETPTPQPTPTQTSTPGPKAAELTGELVPIDSTEPLPPLEPGVNPLTGLPVEDEALQHRLMLVRYGHDRVARPPFGLAAADVVFEELAEGGFITRITGAYLGTLPETVGPIRSARPAVIAMMQQLDGILVYAGASIGVNELLAQQPYPQYCHVCKGSADLFYRMAGRPSPHNLFVHPAAVRQRLQEQGNDTPTRLGGWAFSATAPAGSPATQIHIPYPGEAPVDYRYNPAGGAYLRNVQGVPHTDGLYKKQLAPTNVVVLYLEHQNSNIVEDSLGNVSILVKWIGSGRAQIFRDGVMIEGTWQRHALRELFRLRDSDGNDIPLRPGQTWVEIVPLGYEVTVS